MEFSPLMIVGVMFLVLGTFLILLPVLKVNRDSEADVETGFSIVGFIGPIPFGFGSNRRILLVLLALVIPILITLVILLKLFK